MQLSCLFAQIIPEIGMCHINQGQSALANALAIQISNAIFCDHIADMVARGHHTGAALEHRNNAADHRAIAHHSRAGQSDHRYAALRTRSAIDEVKLTAHAAEQLGTNTVGAHLAGQIHFDRRVDRHHTLVLSDDERVIDVLGWVKLDQRVIVSPLVQPARADHKTGRDLAHVQGLAGIGQNTGLYQANHAI